MPKKRRFIDKKNAITFSLVHRSQNDPLLHDDDAPQRVLQPIADSSEKRKSEQLKFGSFADDEYDYLQHLKPRHVNNADATEAFFIPVETETFQKEIRKRRHPFDLPADVFGSESNASVTPLAQAGPHPDWDEDIVAALDEQCTLDEPLDDLEDDFVALAGGPAEKDDNEEDEWEDCSSDEDGSSDQDGSINDDNLDAGPVGNWLANLRSAGEDIRPVQPPAQQSRRKKLQSTSSRFTEYSMTSSVLARNAGLTQLDEHFETIFERQYAPDEVGAPDDVMGGRLEPDSDLLLRLADDFNSEARCSRLRADLESDPLRPDLNADDSSSEEESEMVECSDRQKPEWDAETILTTASTLYNHPTRIAAPPSNGKRRKRASASTTDEPKGLTHRDIAKLTGKPAAHRNDQDGDDRAPTTTSHVSTKRPPGETPDERRARKAVVKEMRKDRIQRINNELHIQERRAEKSANKLAFAVERTRQSRAVGARPVAGVVL